MIHSTYSAEPSYLMGDGLCLEETDKIRLQRLTQQRKRMEYLSGLTLQQKQTIQILAEENSFMAQQLCSMKVQKEVLHEKLVISGSQSDRLNKILYKQSSLIQSLRQSLLKNNFTNQNQKRLLLNQIQTMYSGHLMYGVTGLTGFEGEKYMQNQRINAQLQRLMEQNHVLSLKYDELCTDYRQLVRNDKIKQFELTKYQEKYHNRSIQKQKASSHLSSKNLNKGSDRNKIDEQASKQVQKLQRKIAHLQKQVSLKDKLIVQHRQNEKQQKKLLNHLKLQFKLEGKQICEISKSNQTIQLKPSQTQVTTYKVQRVVSKSTKKQQDKQQNQQNNQNRYLFDQRQDFQNQFAPSEQFGKKESSSKQNEKITKLSEKIHKKTEFSGFKKTLSKNLSKNVIETPVS